MLFQLLPSRQTEDEEQAIIKEVFHMVSKRDDSSCNFLEGSRYMMCIPPFRPPRPRPALTTPARPGGVGG